MTGLVCANPVVAATFSALLAREYDPPNGRICLLYGDRPLPADSLPLDRWRRTVLVSPHEAVLLPGTIADNLGVMSDDEDVVEKATRAAFADQVIETVPEGARAPVGDRGERLSGGQRQRVALGRALAADSPVLVLHDPTTAVDPATEDLIARHTYELRASMTTVVLTTNPAWLARCDQVVQVTSDRWIIGSHSELLADDADYRATVSR
jgi:putative ABC transport system ATP-binding protein